MKTKLPGTSRRGSFSKYIAIFTNPMTEATFFLFKKALVICKYKVFKKDCVEEEEHEYLNMMYLFQMKVESNQNQTNELEIKAKHPDKLKPNNEDPSFSIIFDRFEDKEKLACQLNEELFIIKEMKGGLLVPQASSEDQSDDWAGIEKNKDWCNGQI